MNAQKTHFERVYPWRLKKPGFMKKSCFSLLYKCLICARNIQETPSKIIAFVI